MSIENILKTFIYTYLNKIGLEYCDWDISRILKYVIMDNETFNHSNPQSHINIDSIDEINEQEMWNLSLHIRNRIYQILKCKKSQGK